MHSDPPNERLGVVTVNKQQLECMNHNGDKLNLRRRKRYVKKKRFDRNRSFSSNYLLYKNQKTKRLKIPRFSKSCIIFGNIVI